MNDETIDDALLREFLLGKINDEERERIEGLFLTDSQAKERVLVAEQDLIEDYLEDTLTTTDRERFVSRYTQTAEQQRKLRITRTIKKWAIAEAASTQTTPVRSSVWSDLLERLRLRAAFVVPVAITALIVIVVVVIWLGRRAEHSAIERELAQLNAPSSLREGPVSAELSPVAVRGVESQSQVNSRPENGIVELLLLWIQKARYPSYEATIHRIGQGETYIVGHLQAERDGKAIRIKLPAHLLIKGTYQIALSAFAADGSVSATEEYTFNVTN